MEGVAWGHALAQQLLADALPRRWAHTQGVAAAAETVAPALGDDGDTLICAAWLHDIGYAPPLADTGFHPLDGARYLREHTDASALLRRLVAHHSCATIEARRRGLDDALTTEFPEPDGILPDALTYCDMTTSPDGHRVDPATRLQEIVDRYGDGHLVAESMKEAHPWVRRAVEAVTAIRV